MFKIVITSSKDISANYTMLNMILWEFLDSYDDGLSYIKKNNLDFLFPIIVQVQNDL